MGEEILMNITSMETRVVLVDNGVLQEVYTERDSGNSIVGNIYKGKIVRVLPGMQAAFINIGLERAAFIHVSEIFSKNSEQEPPSIDTLVNEGQPLIVQVIKDPLGSKGARLTTHISIPARYLVFMPGNNHIGISLRIENLEERERLKVAVETIIQQKVLAEKGGFILRTAAEGVGAEELKADVLFLHRLWQGICEQLNQVEEESSRCVYEEMPLCMRTMRDLVNPNIDRIRIDNEKTVEKISKFVKKLVPELDGKVEHYTGDRPIFDLFGIEDEINRALSRKVQLKSGGYLVIDQTEAMTTIDVNTGGFVGHRNLEETIYKTNLESVTVIARQLRLRNLGGIVIIDFIDMEDQEHKRQVLRTLEKLLEKDHAKTNITGVSELGLVEMTRKRTRESLENTLCEQCPTCAGKGILKTARTVCYEIFREIIREAKLYENEDFLVLASETIIDCLLDEEAEHVANLELLIEKTIRFQVEPRYTQEQFDVVLSEKYCIDV